ncbi:MAG: DEAD/DEAH box helicase [Candidatus Latescibacteria bacterium]|nr:DEAD/DEAH box helicase [Candidatus Latescibacterota bacterium]
MTDKVIENIFSKASPLLSIVDNYEERNEQNQMAQVVYKALKNKEHLLVEAGTGVGKTLAYLLPAALWIKETGKKVLISTYTKILQNQIIHKDIPILREILRFTQNEKNEEISCAVIFGQDNYVCRRRLESTVNYGLFDTPYEFSQIGVLQTWLNEGGSGIIPEFPFMLGRAQEKICRDGDMCKYQKCPFYIDCYYFKARNQWLKADLLVTNHFLFFANVETEYLILPKFDAVVFDEAHRIEEVASKYFGLEVSNYGLHRMLNAIYNPNAKTGIVAHLEIPDSQKRAISDICLEAHDMTEMIFSQFNEYIPRQNTKIRIKKPLTVENRLNDIFIRLTHELLAIQPEHLDEDLELELKNRLKRLEAYRNSISQFLEVGDKNSVYWIEKTLPQTRKNPITYLNSALIDISELFQKKVVEKIPSVILTSATLTAGKDFTFLQNRLGLRKAETLYLSSPFNYKEQAIFVIPTNLPLPNEEATFYPSCAETIDKILTYTNGRALVLFTSFDSLNKTYELVDKTKFPFLIQGQAPIFDLLDNFKKDISSVLFATQSFWQGIDVPGESLSCLIIVRLPFDVPDDPRLEGICEKLREKQMEPFTTYQLPNAVLRFRQGFGRLIRNKLDRGVVCVLDKRIVTKDYGKQFIYSLPKNLPLAFSVEAIKEFFATD